jgi:hypothetical protein
MDESLENHSGEKSNLSINIVKRKRRSKIIQEGRNFVCECGKAYLSFPALNHHKQVKHNNGNIEKRSRGRPRKNVIHNYISLMIMLLNRINLIFFL